MGLVVGTNCGFCENSPSNDPDSNPWTNADNSAKGMKDTSPATAAKVVEIGWWCDTATEAADYEVAIFTHDVGNNRPDALVGKSSGHAKGTGAGWKKVTGLNISIDPSTIYWISSACEDTAALTWTDIEATAGHYYCYSTNETVPDPWDPTPSASEYALAYYAVWEAGAAPPTTSVKIGGAWKSIAALKVNIDDAWKTVDAVKLNVGDNWKAVDIT